MDEFGNVDLINGTSPRPNFDDFVQAFVTIFMVLIGDNWPQYMYTHIIAMGPASSIFFVILQIFGKYVLLNLFLAILLENFEEIEVSEKKEKDTQNTQGSVQAAGANEANSHSVTNGIQASDGVETSRHIKEESMITIIKSGFMQMVQKRSQVQALNSNDGEQGES